MSTLPWWALSPSPFSILFYLILIAFTMRKLLQRINYKRLKYLVAFTDAFFTVGFMVVFLDLIWVIACALRFGSAYPNSLFQLAMSAGRNIVGLILCYLLIGRHFQNGLIHIKDSTIFLFYVNVIFLAVWFSLSASPAWTDWTFAIRHDYPASTVMTSFFISHVVGKSIVASIYYSIWK